MMLLLGLSVKCIPVNFVDPSGLELVIAGIAISGWMLAAAGVSLDWLAGAHITNLFIEGISQGLSALDSLMFANRRSAQNARNLMAFASTAATPPPPNDPNSRGTRTTSTTLYNRRGIRIDVENPGNRLGQIHVQQGNSKYIYDVATQSFRTPGGAQAPRAIQNLLQNNDVVRAIGQGLRILGY